MKNAVQIDAGKWSGCAIKPNGRAYCWGDTGNLGHGYTYANVAVPTMVLSPEKWLKNVIDDGQIIEANTSNTLSWSLPSSSAGVLILRHTSRITEVPAHGTSYVAGDSLAPPLWYAGVGTSYADTGLTNG